MSHKLLTMLIDAMPYFVVGFLLSARGWPLWQTMLACAALGALQGIGERLAGQP